MNFELTKYHNCDVEVKKFDRVFDCLFINVNKLLLLDFNVMDVDYLKF